MLQIRHVSKFFPGVRALNDVSIDFLPGEIHAVVGENGAGKSTLIKIICGIYAPDEGEVLIDDSPVHLDAYKDALDRKINLVSQEIQVIPKSTIGENVMLDKIERYARFGKINWQALNRDAQRYVDLVELGLPVSTVVSGLSAAQKQLLMIARALSANARFLILDEPTSALTRHETDNLLQLLKRIKADGVTIIFVSHKLEEVLEIGDKVSVLRDGNLAGTQAGAGLTKQDLVKLMIGRESRTLDLGVLNVDHQQKVLEARNISQPGAFDNVSFTLYKGEILGFYGLVGSGRTELAQIILGEERKSNGEVYVNGEPAIIHSMADSLYKYRMGYVSENRKEKGLILGASIKTNIAITVWKDLRNRIGAIKLGAETGVAEHYMQALEVKATDPDQLVNRLSGGNQQKVSIAKWLAAACDILIIDEPTIGVDIGAKEYIHQLIWDLAKNKGKSIILISSDMPEIVAVARRILVFRDYRIVGEVRNDEHAVRGYDEMSHAIGAYLA